jgi:hypothetical protein
LRGSSLAFRFGASQAEAETIAQKIREENAIAKTAGQYFQVVPMKQHLVDEVRPAILALMGAVIFPVTDCVCECSQPDAGESGIARTRTRSSGRVGRWLVGVGVGRHSPKLS